MKPSQLIAALLTSITFAHAAITVAATAPSVRVDQQTVAATLTPIVPALCDNGGLQWAYNRDYQSIVPPIDVSAIKRQAPLASGVTNYVGIYDPFGQTAPIYDSPAALVGVNYTVNHRGYLLAPESGLYTLSATNVDDMTIFWLGPQAYSGWSYGNAQFGAYWVYGMANTGYIRLNAGEYYPIRLFYKQGSGHAMFDFKITSPSGLVLLNGDKTAQPSPFVVQFSCDGRLAPRYQDFGRET